jgi:cyclase
LDPQREREEEVKTTLRLTLAAALAAAGAAFAQPAIDPAKVEIKATKLTGTTYMLTGAGGNLGLSAGEDAVFLIDDQFAPLTPKIKAAIAQITKQPVKFVLNTHWHYDHTGGNEGFGKEGSLIVAHENVRKRMSTDQVIEFFNQPIKASPKAALPVVTFNGAMSFHINGEEIRGIHVPRAHTDGDTIVHFLGSDVVHMGDVYFNGYYPFIDTSSGGTIDGVIAACDQVLGIVTDRTRIIPGHGPLASKADLQGYRDMLATVAGRVGKMIAEGRKLEEITAAKSVTEDYDAKWGKGFIPPHKFREMVAMNLLKNAK